MKYKLIIPSDIKPKPTKDEQDIGAIMSEKFSSDVVFIKRSTTNTTPDIKIGNTFWEIKSPRGNSKYTISDSLRRAKRQSQYIVISLARTKMTSRQAEARTRDFLKRSSVGIKRLLIVTKNNKVIDIK